MFLRTCKSYFLKAATNLWRNRVMSLTATIIIALCLVMLGVAIILGFNVNYVSEQLEGQYEIHVYVDMTYTEEQAQSLRGNLEAVEYVKAAEFVSKEQALTEMENSMEDSKQAFEMLHGEENPLPHTYDITLTDVKQADNVVANLSKIEGVDEVRNRSDILDKIVSTTRGAQLFSVVLMIVFALFGVYIISYAIKTSVMSRSNEIEIMKYVGATDWYIRWPFVIEGTTMGIVGAVVSFIPIYIMYDRIVKVWTESMPLFNLIPSADLRNALIIVFLVIGCILGALGSVLSIRKHLKV